MMNNIAHKTEWYYACTKCQELIKKDLYEDALEVLTPFLNIEKEIIQFYAGILFQQTGQVDTAISHWLRFLNLKPDFNQAHYNLAACYALKGDLSNSYKHFEHRFGLSPTYTMFHDRFAKHWDGKETGEEIYVYHEQGLGDFIQWIRFLPRLKEFFKTVTVECPKSLCRFLPEGYVVLPRDNQPLQPSCELGISLGSLPYLLGVTRENIPQAPYIPLGELKIEGEKKIGVCWCGSKFYDNDAYRSMLVEDFLPLERFGKLFNLTIEPSPFVNFDFKDFRETADVIGTMDLVVAVDTAVSHLAGAMGKPVWMITGRFPDPRWELGDKTPWYPSMKIFRTKNFREFMENLVIDF